MSTITNNKKSKVDIEPILLDIDGIYQLLGGSIGKNTILQMMKDNEFETLMIGEKRKLVATTKSVKQKIESWMDKPTTCGGMKIMPNKFFIDFTNNI
jgi:hypothetical protein